MFERFTDGARRVVVLAQEEARILQHSYIGTEHLLLGLIREGGGVAAKALDALGISLPDVRQDIEEIIGRGEPQFSAHIPFTPRAKKVMELSLREALELDHEYIGTEHILLALIREAEGVAAQVLVKRGAELTKVREKVIWVLEGSQEVTERAPEKGASVPPVRGEAQRDCGLSDDGSSRGRRGTGTLGDLRFLPTMRQLARNVVLTPTCPAEPS